MLVSKPTKHELPQQFAALEKNYQKVSADFQVFLAPLQLSE